MSSVFGYAKVQKVVQTGEKRFAHVVFDEELNDSQVIICSQELPIGTKLYWEFDCETKKTSWMVI